MVLVVAVAAVAVLTVMLWSIIRAILRSPDIAAVLSAHPPRRARLSRGLAGPDRGRLRRRARGAQARRRGRADRARRAAGAAAHRAGAQLSGDRDAAERTFHAMAARDDTKLLGLHGLIIEAQRRNDAAAARLYAEEAAKSARAPAWAGQAVLDSRCAAGDWVGALERLDRNMKSGLVDRDAYRRQRAVLLTARALEADAQRRPRRRPRAGARSGEARADAGAGRGARRPAAGRGRRPAPRRAHRRGGVEGQSASRSRRGLCASAARRFRARPAGARRDRWRQKTPGNIEGALAVARAALDAQEFAVARRALAPLSIAPSQRVAMLMAEIEEKEHGDEGRAREWMTRAVRARRDPAWTADGIVSDRWMPVSPVTGRLDAFQWKDPLAELDADEAVIEHDREPRAVDGCRRRRCRRRVGRDPSRRRPSRSKRSRSSTLPATPPPASRRPRTCAHRPRRRRSSRWSTCPTIPARTPQPQLEPETETSPSRPATAGASCAGCSSRCGLIVTVPDGHAHTALERAGSSRHPSTTCSLSQDDGVRAPFETTASPLAAAHAGNQIAAEQQLRARVLAPAAPSRSAPPASRARRGAPPPPPRWS